MTNDMESPTDDDHPTHPLDIMGDAVKQHTMRLRARVHGHHVAMSEEHEVWCGKDTATTGIIHTFERAAIVRW